MVGALARKHLIRVGTGLDVSLRLLLIGLVLGPLQVTVSWAKDNDVLSPERPFHVGEQFTYEISWMKINAGTAVMGVTVTEKNGDQPLVKLVTTAQTRPVITKFFPVDNRVE